MREILFRGKFGNEWKYGFLSTEPRAWKAKEYLSQVKKLNTAIKTKDEELRQLKLNAACVQSVAITERVMSSHDNSSNKTVDKIVDMQHEINDEIDELVDLKAEIRAKIANVYNQTYIDVLTNLYINCFTLDKTAEVMNSDRRTVCRWHGQALQIFRKENNML